MAVLARLRTLYDPSSRSPEALRALVDPIYFCERYVRPHDVRWTKPTAQFQIDMVYHLLAGSRFDPALLRQLLEDGRPLTDAEQMAETAFRTALIPIEHGKTTWLSVGVPLWTITVDQEVKGALIGNRKEDAQKPLTTIKWHIENNQLLRADFPELRPDYRQGWSDERIYVERRDRSKDPTIQTSGITGTIQGARLDWVLGDDVQDRKRALSETMNQADQETWQEINENRVVDGGICGCYGTLQSSRDLVMSLSRSPGYRHMHLAATDREGRYGPKGLPLFHTRERLALARARQGERRYARKYDNDAKDEGGKQLKAEWIHMVGFKDIPWDKLRYYAGVDPATGEAETSNPDEYCICWGAKDPRGVVYVLGFRASEDWGITEGTKQLASLHAHHHFARVAIESVAYGVAAKQRVWEETSVPAYKSPSTKDKATRFESLGTLFDVQRVVLYDKAPGAFGNDDEPNFWDQWIDFPEGQHDDRVDACEKMVEAAIGARKVREEPDDRTRELLSGARLT